MIESNVGVNGTNWMESSGSFEGVRLTDGVRARFHEPERIESDSLGSLGVPGDAYYGIQTQRACVNFRTTGIPVSRWASLIDALIRIKQSAAHANAEVGVLPRRVANAIQAAGDEILAGRLRDQFVVEMLQGGAGTSTNMNVNEVLANRALERMGHRRGDYEFCHPNDHVNLSQSTNDVFPTAVKIALTMEVRHAVRELRALSAAFEQKAGEYEHVIKMGRTQLQDAVPVTFGQSFRAWSTIIRGGASRLEEVSKRLLVVNLGGTAIGTEVNAPEGYRASAIRRLRELSRLDLECAEDLIACTQDTGPFVEVSGALKVAAVQVSRIASDLRLLSSGPRAGFGEIDLPAMQPGSSIMPGKVNPVVPELFNQIAISIRAHDQAVTDAAEAGQLELNVMLPLVAECTLDGAVKLARGARQLADSCVSGIKVHEEACATHVQRSLGLATALCPRIGYERAAIAAKDARESGRTLLEVVCDYGWLSEGEAKRLLDPVRMLGPSA